MLQMVSHNLRPLESTQRCCVTCVQMLVTGILIRRRNDHTVHGLTVSWEFSQPTSFHPQTQCLQQR